MIGDFSNAVTEAVVESLGTHESMSTQILSNDKRLKDFAELLMTSLMSRKRGLPNDTYIGKKHSFFTHYRTYRSKNLYSFYYNPVNSKRL